MTIYVRPDDLPAWAESGDKVQPTSPEIQAGWPASTIPPSRQRFNWILNFVANAIRYFMQRGIPEWSTNEDYPLAGRVQHAGVTWVAILANTGIEPGTDPATWERWGYAESELATFLDPITPDATNNRVGINNATPGVTLDIVATDAIKLPIGTTAQRPAGANGLVRFNSTLSIIEAWITSAWVQIGGVIADATTTVKGIVELATDAETQAGTDAVRAITPSNLSARTATESRTGILELATSAEAIAGSDDATAITPLKLRNGLNASGSAPVYACRAWVNFVGTGTPAISASGNVSSITDNGTGDYTVNFTTAMVDENYSVAVSGARQAGSANNGAYGTIRRGSASFTSSSIRVTFSADNTTPEDPDVMNVSIFR